MVTCGGRCALLRGVSPLFAERGAADDHAACDVVVYEAYRSGALLPVWGAARRVWDNRVGADYRDLWSNREQRHWRLPVDFHCARNARGQPGGISEPVCYYEGACIVTWEWRFSILDYLTPPRMKNEMVNCFHCYGVNIR